MHGFVKYRFRSPNGKFSLIGRHFGSYSNGLGQIFLSCRYPDIPKRVFIFIRIKDDLVNRKKTKPLIRMALSKG